MCRTLPLALLALALTSPALAEEGLISATFDPTGEDGGFAAVERFTGQLPDFPQVVRLDLTVKPDSEGWLAVALIETGAKQAMDLDCRNGYGFVAGSYSKLILPLQGAYPHLRLEVLLNGLNETDGLVMACEYTGSGPAQFRLQGEFVVSKTSIPTAHDVVLSARPVQ